jgi:anti-sigma factor RsiW
VNDCRDLEDVLSAYVDGEAVDEDCARVRTHIESCGVCRDRVAGERQARDAVRARREVLRTCAPEALKARCAAHAAAVEIRADRAAAAGVTPPILLAQVPRRTFVRRWAPLSLAATVLLAVASVFALGLTDTVQALAFQTTIDHVTCSRFKGVAKQVDHVTEAQRWQERFGWPITVPASSEASKLQLQAVRRCLLTEGSVAHLMYEWEGKPFSVYVLPKRTLPDSPEVASRLSHNAVMWSQNERTYIVVTTHAQGPSLDAVVSYVRTHSY